jgi:arylformamidase
MAAPWIDITRRIDRNVPVYPGDPPPQLRTRTDRSGITMTRLTILTHTGTHLDLPAHVIPNAPGPDFSRLARVLIGRATLVRFSSGRRPVGAEEMAHTLGGGRFPQRLLLQTCPAGRSFRGLSSEAARMLAGRVRLVGTDALSIDPQGKLDAHRILLGGGTLFIESLDLAGAPAGSYDLVALPLRLAAPDGAPVRALIRPGRGTPRGGDE